MVKNLSDVLSSVVRRNDEPQEGTPAVRENCLVCDSSLADSGLYQMYRVCQSCHFHYTMTARERIDTLADRGSFREINRSVTSLDPLSFSSRVSYKERLRRDQRRTGLTEAAVTGTCAIGGTLAVLIVLDFGFMGGSMGVVVGEKVALAFEHAAKRKKPVVAIVTSGGARIQEGVLSLMQMAKTSIAARRLDAKGLPFISVLSNPASGHAYASFANLADIILAEPGSIVGLAPMRTIREVTDSPLPDGSHTAESHLKHGMLDGIVTRERLKDLLAVLLDLFGSQYQITARQKGDMHEVEPPVAQAWDSVQLARHESRPTARDYIDRIISNFVEIHGDRSFGDDGAIVSGLGRLGGQTVVVIGQERGRAGEPVERHQGMTSPEGFRKAQRALHLAQKFKVPLVTLIDTPGPYSTLDSEERGLGNTIATTMAEIGSLETPTISVVIGEGGSEGALALAVADRVLMMENAIYSIISPEDAADIIFQDAGKADEVAESLRLTAQDCKELGIVDSVVQEPAGGAHTNPDESARHLERVLMHELAEVQSRSMKRVLRDRYKKFRKMGEYNSYFRTAITREVNSLQGLVATGVKRIARRRAEAPVVSDEVEEAEETGAYEG